MKKLPDTSIGQFKLHMNWSLMLEPLNDKNYRLLLKYFPVEYGYRLGAAFFIPHMLNNLHMNFTRYRFI